MYGNAIPEGVTPEEFQRLLLVRRETLEDATRKASGGSAMPITWRHGWKATLKILGRDKDGSLKASVTVVGPHASSGYVRKVRLVTQYRVNLNRS